MVFDSRPITSVILLAALPVGAASKTFLSICSKRSTKTLVVVVFPQPGPPVKIAKGEDMAWMILFCCSSLKLSFCFFRNSFISS